MSMTSKEQSDALDAWLGPRGWSKQKSIYPSGFIDYASKDTDMIWIGWAAAHEELCAVHTAQIDELKKELTTRNAELEVEVARLNVSLKASRLANREPYIDQLEAEVRKLKGALRKIREISFQVLPCNDTRSVVYDIARNALKESGL